MKKIAVLILCLLIFSYLTLPVFAKNFENEYFKVNRNSEHLHSRLSKRYTGYEYKIKNTSHSPVEITDIALIDNISGETAYLSIRRTGIGAAAQTLAWGTALMLPTLTTSLILSVAAVPFIIVGNFAGNHGAKMEARRFDKPLLYNTIMAGETAKFKTLAPHRSKPVLKIFYKNPDTSEINVFECE